MAPRKPKPSIKGTDFSLDKARLDMRCPLDLRELLIDAATVANESLTGFVLHAAFDRARQVIRNRDLVEKAEVALRRMPWVRL